MGGSKQSEGCVEAYFVAGHILSRKYAATVVCLQGERERQTDRQTGQLVRSTPATLVPGDFRWRELLQVPFLSRYFATNT